ncbi:MAG: hypothetical protein ABIS45_00355, partial [Burkholderiales bacterium]
MWANSSKNCAPQYYARAHGSTPEGRSYAGRIEAMAAAAQNDSLIPAQYAHLQLGRGTNEVCGDPGLVGAAPALHACM